MRKTTIAIQGIRGSFHDQAARHYFGNSIEIMECRSFRESVQKTAENLSDYTVIAIENAIAGGILNNYSLVREHKLKVQGELFLPIDLHLFAISSDCTPDKIISHPMALTQCRGILHSYNKAEICEGQDTASCARELAISKNKTTAVIAGKVAGDLYQLHLLQKNVHSALNNYTRFWILSKGGLLEKDRNKCTICFDVSHTPGSLARVLALFGKHFINLSRIQSIPSHDDPVRFLFYADLEWSDYVEYTMALKKVKRYCNIFEHLGEYQSNNELLK